MQIDDRIFVPPLPDNDEDQGGRADQRQRNDEVGFEPVIALSFVEDDLQGSKSKRDKSQADVVDASLFEFAALEVRRILNEARGQKDGKNSDRDIDKENPAPREVVSDPSAKRGSDRWCSDDRHAVYGKRHASLSRRKCV